MFLSSVKEKIKESIWPGSSQFCEDERPTPAESLNLFVLSLLKNFRNVSFMQLKRISLV